MKLKVSGLDATVAPNKFEHLFGRYIYGIRPWTHCDRGLMASHETAISPTMKDNDNIQLKDELFYLCGVGNKSKSLPAERQRKYSNVHLAVRPQIGSVASVDSLYGVTFTIEDAVAIPIQALPDDFEGLPPAHARCKNFQFAYQMFEVTRPPKSYAEPVHLLREAWRDTPGIRHNGEGLMSKP
jgi:hypothetical protein